LLPGVVIGGAACLDIVASALNLILTFDPALVAIVALSLQVSVTAVVLATLAGAPAGAALAIWAVPGRQAMVVLATTFMALPPVVVGLFVYMTLSRAGPLGQFGLLYTPTAMVIAQTILIFPIIVALAREAVLPLQRDYGAMLKSMDAGRWLTLQTMLWDARFGLATAVLAGFGRAIAEVGAVIIVGGNINGLTRVMTTTIALETSKGNLELALALGVILILLALLMNVLIHLIAGFGRRYQVVS
jgi:tungstate transport system permease protein